jgi:hypothetical protein
MLGDSREALKGFRASQVILERLAKTIEQYELDE